MALACGDGGQESTTAPPPTSFSTSLGSDGEGDGTMGGDTLDDGANTSTSSTTAFDTLTTAATSGPPDPTNTSGDTNDTGTSQVDIAPDDLIDDLEDGDAVIYEIGGRIGVWYAYDDGSAGTSNPAAGDGFLPTAGGPNGSNYSAHLVGSGFSTWGAGMGFDLDNSGGATKHPFDASGYTGIAFQARGQGTIQFKAQTEAVVPTSEGGTCNAGGSCNDSHATQVVLTATWQQHVIPFASLAQAGWGQGAAWDPSSLMGLQWEAPSGSPFEIVIDDVGFY
ncbi:CIA30 family protein [Paraliomyxa miuraensis]|uniref:carbohydrate binding domain-containing protein n=1 Tax=Paraliomyxa miuraensis TaxID=376150 RepID=UPI00224F2221|nr:carbohydrate binding domain-containing protein [Paraliomyxa miuraensis]MCX4246981.1 CIA30 family protein [Paraliomyxa miuraensis]